MKICSCCGDEAEPVMINCGVGPYEYWGMRGVDVNMQELSQCCEAECVEGGVSLLRRVTRIARKQHFEYNSARKISVGSQFVEETLRHWRKDGPSWITTRRYLIGRAI